MQDLFHKVCKSVRQNYFFNKVMPRGRCLQNSFQSVKPLHMNFLQFQHKYYGFESIKNPFIQRAPSPVIIVFPPCLCTSFSGFLTHLGFFPSRFVFDYLG